MARRLLAGAFVAFLAFAGTNALALSSTDGGTLADAQLRPVLVPAPPRPPGEAQRAPAAFSTAVESQDFAGEAKATSELVATAPGAVVRDYGGLGQLATLSLRGASAEEVLVLLDGVPLTSASGGAVDLSTVPASLLDRVEVIRGAVGAVYGPGALGGVVNLVTRAPAPGATQLWAELVGGSFGTGQLQAAGSGQAGPGALLVSVGTLSSQGDFPYEPPDGPIHMRQNNDARQLSGLARYTMRAGGRATLDLQAEAQGGERGLAGPIGSPSPDDRLATRRTSANARLAEKVVDGEIGARAFARQDRTTVDLGGHLGEPQIDTLAGAEGRGRWLWGRHGVQLLVRGAGEGLTGAGPARARPDTALAASDEWLLAAGRVSILPAARLDYVDHFLGASPQLGAAWRPRPAWEVKGSVGRSFRAPSLTELYVDQGLIASNPALRPETATAADLGLSYRRGRVLAAIDGYGSLYSDLITYELYPPFRAKPFNVGTAGIYGAEAELAVRPLASLALSGSYAFTHTQDLYDDARYFLHQLPYHPRHTGFARVAWLGERASAHLEGQVQSSQFINRANTVALPARLLVNLGGAVRPVARAPVWVGLEMKNALDDQSQDLYGYPLPGRALFASLRLEPHAEPDKDVP